jgi:hypothetical protein
VLALAMLLPTVGIGVAASGTDYVNEDFSRFASGRHLHARTALPQHCPTTR